MSERGVVSPRAFMNVWIGVAVSYFICATILTAYGILYFYMLWRAQSVLFSVELLGVSVQPDLYPYMGAATLAIALIHLYHLSVMVGRSLQARSLRFPSSFSRDENKVSCRVTRVISATLDAIVPISLWKSFDVTNPNYGVVYVFRETVQTGIQTQQAYNISAHVAKTWMNHSIVFLLVLNCWAMPLISHVLKVSSTPTSRLLCLIIDLVLDFVSYFAFPIALFVPYAKDFNPTIGSYTQLFWYRDAWFMQLKNGWPIVFATSIWDGLSRLLIMFSMTRTLRSIAKLLQSSSSPSVSVVVGCRDQRAPSSAGLVSVAPLPVLPGPEKTLSRHLSRLPPVPVLRSRAERWGHNLLALWGLLVLVLHIQASSTRTNPQCLLQVRPWFVRRSACSLMEMNCYNGHLTGNASEFNSTLDSIDSEWVSYLIIRHCSAVAITPRIQDLSWLMGIKIHNSTLVSWDVNAALTQTNHPNMAFAFIISTNVTNFPQALYHRDFPFKLQDIELSMVNVTDIPSEVAEIWHPGTFLVMEGLQLPAFPEVLAMLQPSYFSIACNNFSEIPRVVFENPYLVALNLNGNPISELPLGQFTIVSLDVVLTNVTKIPLWLDTSSQSFELQAGDTPLCGALHQRNVSALGLRSDEEMEKWQRLVECTPVDGRKYLTHFPLEDEATNNPSII